MMARTSSRGKAAEGPAMSLSAWEQQALDSIKNGLAGSDPELAALLSAFNQLASDGEMPDREKIKTGPGRAMRRLRHARWRSSFRRVRRRLGCRRVAVLLWLVITAVLIAAVALALNVGAPTTCPETVVNICTGPAPGHSPGTPSRNATTSQVPRQRAADLPQAGP
jgi:hypothetical protein